MLHFNCRGGGFISLENLLYFAKNYTVSTDPPDYSAGSHIYLILSSMLFLCLRWKEYVSYVYISVEVAMSH